MATKFEKLIQGTPAIDARVVLSLLDGEIGSLAYVDPGDPYPDREPWTLETDEGTTTGKSAVEAWDEATAHGLQPKRMWSIFPAAPLGSDPGDRVKIHTAYTMGNNGLRITVSGTNRIAVDGISARLRRLVEQLEEPASAATLSTEKVTPRSDYSTHMQIGTQNPSIPTQNPSIPTQIALSSVEGKSESWIRKSWKDHTATFVVTIAGTVIAAALILWLGLSA